ncbi:hypothetical protein BVY00_02305 [bacterium G20]|nr:hypothetical protein BVY00_02305 [bacterium G20]
MTMTSPELYPGLDAKLDAIYERNVAEGIAKPAEAVVVQGLEAVVNQQIAQARNSAPALAEADQGFRELAAAARQRLNKLLTDTATNLPVPELSELEGVNWQHLAEGYTAMERLGLEPQLVIAPEGQPLKEFWQELFSHLRQWQDDNQPNATHRLKKQTDGDGLWINDEVKNHWSELTPEQPGWSVSVIPTIGKAPVLNVDHKGQSTAGETPKELNNILDQLPLNQTAESGLEHPSLERYLTLQAIRLQTGQEPLDDQIGGIYYWSWLDGTFQNSDGNTAAPNGYWNPDDGRVRLAWDRVDGRGAYLGVRPEVRG